MKERERIVLTGVLSVLLLAWLGFLVHRSPQLCGQRSRGGVRYRGGRAHARPARLSDRQAHSLSPRRITRARFVADVADRCMSTRAFLGPLLAIIHTGHKFDSWLGITLTAVMLLVVVSGFVGSLPAHLRQPGD